MSMVGGKLAKTVDDYRQLAQKLGYAFVGDIPASTTKKSDGWRCAQGHVRTATYSAMNQSAKRNGVRCRQCPDRSLAQYKALAESKGGEYIASDVPMDYKDTVSGGWKCSKGHTWSDSFKDVDKKGSWCPECAGLNREVLKQYTELAKQKNLIYSLNYVPDSLDTPIAGWKCPDHQVPISYSFQQLRVLEDPCQECLKGSDSEPDSCSDSDSDHKIEHKHDADPGDPTDLMEDIDQPVEFWKEKVEKSTREMIEIKNLLDKEIKKNSKLTEKLKKVGSSGPMGRLGIYVSRNPKDPAGTYHIGKSVDVKRTLKNHRSNAPEITLEYLAYISNDTKSSKRVWNNVMDRLEDHLDHGILKNIGLDEITPAIEEICKYFKISCTVIDRDSL